VGIGCSLMSFHPISAGSLTPSRPAPPAPHRRPTDPLPPAPYSGIGATPGAPDAFAAGFIRSGTVIIKEEGGFSSWLWKTKWVVLREQTISIHKSEVRAPLSCLAAPSPLAPVLAAAGHPLPPRHLQHRAHRSQALLSSARVKGQALLSISQRR
jgi:hypothetical protein